jgi:dihydrolipoamide dehydrogenase
MAKYDYNLSVIGAGSAGLVTSYIAAQLNARVALIEKNKMGGDCLNTGCVPSKALIRSAKVAHLMQNAATYGFKECSFEFNFEDIMNRVQNVIERIEPHDSVERYTKLGVDCISSKAMIRSPHEIEVEGRTITTKTIVVATGARPIIPNIPGVEKVNALTSDTLWNLKVQPKRLLVIGAGPIGCELAQSFQRLGTQVTIVDLADRILPREDQDVSEELQKQFHKEGIEFQLSSKAKEFTVKHEQKCLTVDCQGQQIKIEFDEVLFAVGRIANTEGFGLQEIGVQLNSNRTIQTDANLRTDVKNIFACGDVVGPYQFTHMASHQAYYACVNALFHPFTKIIPPPFNRSLKVDYSVVPWATYTDPEIATVGLTESVAKDKNIKYQLTHYGIDDLDRAIADEQDKGLVKVLTQPNTDKILGATIVGHNASELITEFIAAMKNNYGLNSILSTIHIYPTMAEANKYAAGNWKRKNKPETALKVLRKFFAWRRGL